MSNTDNTNNNSIDKKKTSTKKKSIPSKNRKKTIITEDTPLTELQHRFVACYMESNNATQAYREAGYKCDKMAATTITIQAAKLKAQPNVRKQIILSRKKFYEEKMATGEEVMAYLAAVMRGEVKDQFGLEAPISERTRAGLEIAKRTIDFDLIESRKSNVVSQDNNIIKIQVDWNRDSI